MRDKRLHLLLCSDQILLSKMEKLYFTPPLRRSVDTVRFFCSAVRMSDQVTPNQIMSLSDGLVITTVDLMVFLMSFDSDDHY